MLAGVMVVGVASAQAGQFAGVTIEAKLIGGQQYEGLYGRIANWEAETSAKVDIISKKNHVEIDREIKSDMAAVQTPSVQRVLVPTVPDAFLLTLQITVALF